MAKFVGFRAQLTFSSQVIFFCITILCVALCVPLQTQAAFNPEINYQGKLIDTGTGDPVATDDYNFEFKLYDAPTGGNLVWTETRTGGNQVTVTDGLFSVMLGSVNSLASVNFNQTLYLTVNVGGTGAPTWDGEMTPRKRLGAVTAAFEADRLDGLTSSDFLSTSTFSAPSIGSVGSSSATTTAAGNFVVSGATRLASSLSGILKATAGYVTTALVDLANDVTGILGIDNGGTGIATTPSYGQLLVGNGSGYTLTATSSLGVAISDTTGTLAVARGGTNATAQTTNGVSYFNGTAITSGSSLVFNGTNLGVGTSTPSYTLSVEGTVGFQGNNFATTTIGNFTSNVTIGAIDSFIGKIPFIRSLAEDGTALLVNKGAFYVQEDLATNALPIVGFISDDLSSSATITYATTTGALAISSTATTTSNVGFDISSGCYAINGTCITASGSSQWTTSGDDVFYINSNGGGVGVLNDFMPTFILGKADASDFAGFTWSSSTDRLSFTGAIGGYGFDGPIINSSSTATSTFAGDIQIASGKNLQVSNIFAYSPLNISTNLNVTGAGTSTFANGITLTTGCITVGGVCVGGYATTSVDYWLTTKTTDDLVQGASNLYWSNTLFDNRLSASSSIAGITTLSNLTSVGTITSGTWSATEIGISKGGTNATSQTTNGVTYYDGTSITSGTTLVFNGTNLGVGSSTPGFKLSVAGDAWFDDGGGTTNIWAEQSEIIRNDGVTNYFGNVSGVSLPVVIRAGGADRMYIDNSTGFVGIGTSSPTQLLELRTSGALGPVIKLDAAESGAGAWALVAKASGNLATG
nr:hypothetical protein [Candidatus Buchananbacteria bacterium]